MLVVHNYNMEHYCDSRVAEIWSNIYLTISMCLVSNHPYSPDILGIWPATLALISIGFYLLNLALAMTSFYEFLMEMEKWRET